jgi:glycosyltransferase A (GT-A) superfamily protein (DUF2064 family)
VAWPLPDRAVLGIFGNQPAPGPARERLAAALGEELAASAQNALMFDFLELWGSERILAPGGRRVFVYGPSDAGPWFDPRVPDSFALQPQTEGDFGERTRAFFAGELDEGAERVVVVGTGTPTLDPSIVLSAFLCLESRDVVLGPNTSGGCYLVGSRRIVPPIFEATDWRQPGSLQVAIERLGDSGVSVAVLPPWYDVDAPRGWQTLVGHVRALRRAGTDPGLPRLEALLEHA